VGDLDVGTFGSALSLSAKLEPTMERRTQERVCVVGAGPAGLAMARALKVYGIPFDAYERHRAIGGIWDQSNPGSPIYNSTHFISSKTQSNFLDFEMPDHYPDYPSHRQILAYLRAFARGYDLQSSIRFNTHVEHIAPRGKGWSVRLSSGETREYGWLVAASGAFTGEARHASTYRSPEEFKGKRVLVIGAGNSGCDIACDIAQTAGAAFISLRRGYHFIPKHVFGKPFDVFADQGRHLPVWLSQFLLGRLLRIINGDLTRFGLKRPDHKVLESHPILNTQILHHLSHGNLTAKPNVSALDGGTVVFEDGTREPIDVIIYATGYTWKLPYLEEGLVAWEGGRPDLYMKLFSREHPRLFVLGLFETNAAGYKVFDNMADLVARAILAQRSRAEARRLAEFTWTDRHDTGGGIHYVKSERHAGYVDYLAYLKQMARLRKHMGWPPVMPGQYDHVSQPLDQHAAVADRAPPGIGAVSLETWRRSGSVHSSHHPSDTASKNA
jgi:hypothetical protein